MIPLDQDRSKPHWRLSSVLVIPFVLEVVSVVGLIGWLSFHNSQRAIDDLATQLMNEMSARIEDQLAAHLNEAKTINRLNQAAIENQLLDPDNDAQLSQQFWRQMVQFPRMSYIYWGDEKGQYSGSGREPDGQLVIAVLEETTLNHYQPDQQGLATDQFVRGVDDYDPRERPWYADAATVGGPTWSSIFVWSSNSNISIDSLYPVYSQGELQGVLGISLGLLSLSDFLRELDIGQTGEAFIIERTGDIVANSTPNLPFTPGTQDQRPTRLQALNNESLLIQSATEHLQQIFGGLDPIQATTNLTFELEGQRQFVQVVPFTLDGIEWLIVVTVPASDFMAQINTNTHNTILLAIAALITAILIGFLTTRQLVRPIQNLMLASQDLATGHLDRQVKQDPWIYELSGLARSFNTMASQLKESFTTLEDRVRERTAELADANVEIQVLNQKLREENLRLGAELDIAKQLQQLVLPKPEELEIIRGVDIAGYMETADEVGGDYYDVLETDEILTIAIGDVTGHGLESGILMLMTQTAVRTLQEIQEWDPVKFLDTLNRTIFKNVQRMDSDKSLTLAIVNYADGQVSISGQHEETLVVRADGSIERINTIDLGFPIGLDNPITDFVGQVKVELNPGDGIVLYTDGITEAENDQGEQYQIERLCQVISCHWHQTADHIKQAVIQDVKTFIGSHKVYDDITLVILKRLVAAKPQFGEPLSGKVLNSDLMPV